MTLQRKRWYALGLGAMMLWALTLRLVYSWPLPDESRFWDERYSFENVRSLYQDRTLVPASSYYPSPVVSAPPTLLIALSESLAEKTGDGRFDAFEAGEFLPAAYRWARGLQALYGTLAIFLLYRVGARLFGRAAGFLAALMVAFMAGPIHACGEFVPDALLGLTVTGALLASVRQIQRPGWSRAVATGFMIALAASSKLTGIAIAAPLAAVSLALGNRDRRYLRDLATSAVTSFIAFVALNPYWTAYLGWIGGLRDDYAMRARWSEMTRLQTPSHVFQFLTSTDVLGKYLGTAALLAFALLVARALSPNKSVNERAAAAMVVIFPIAFSVSYGVQTAYFKANQFLVILPFVALALAWLATSSWRFASASRWGRRLGAWSTSALAALTMLAAAWGSLSVYRALIPTTLDRAKMALSRHDPGHRVYLVEETASVRGGAWERSQHPKHNRVALDQVESLAAVDEQDLMLADGWIFVSGGNEFHQSLRRRIRGRSPHHYALHRFEAKWLEARGPDLEVVVAWPRRLPFETKPVRRPCGQDCTEGELPGRRYRNEAFAFSLWIPLSAGRVGKPMPTLEVDGRPIRLLPGPASEQGAWFQSVRFRPAAEPSRWVLRVGTKVRGLPSVEITRWRLRRPGERQGRRM